VVTACGIRQSQRCIGACEAGNEVVLPCVDCSLGRVAAAVVAVWRCKLEVDLFLVH
jgi:hypothetical protein